MSALRFASIALAMTLCAPTLAQAAPFVDFAGYSWLVRTYGGGPGPNSWSADNVFVDADGLHLRITEIDGVWTCAEVVMQQSLGFGTYSFEVTGQLDGLDRNTVLGLFNYPSSEQIGPSGTNEIDIEFSQWGVAGNPNRLNWSVYPPALGPKPLHKELPLPSAGTASTHSFTWTSSAVRYAAFEGYGDASAAEPVAKWASVPRSPLAHIPQVPLPVHMNFWLTDGKGPSDGQPAEIVIRDFHFTPE